MSSPQELTALVESYLDDLALTPELGELGELTRAKKEAG
jgi:hypothetical protein